MKDVTHSCDGCGRKLVDGRWATVDIDYSWPPIYRHPSEVRPNRSALAELVNPSRLSDSARQGMHKGEYCSWKCAQAMFDYIAKHDSREYLRV